MRRPRTRPAPPSPASRRGWEELRVLLPPPVVRALRRAASGAMSVEDFAATVLCAWALEHGVSAGAMLGAIPASEDE